jgi:hypothetical protein
MKLIHVTKASGEQEPFDESKLKRSLKNAGASEAVTEEITESIKNTLYNDITTQKIYTEAFRQLRLKSQKSAGRYKLKEAIFELGPTGFPFEKFIAELLTRLGYESRTGVTVKGDCVTHEIDVIAHKENEYLLAECKFHNRQENRCNVIIPLYVQSRFLDVKKNWSRLPGHRNQAHKGCVVTNTRFTSDAQTYGECAGLKMLSWDFPKDNGIKDLITRLNLHPITSLSSLNKNEKEQILKQDLIFCSQVCDEKAVLENAGIDPRKIPRIMKEATAICNNNQKAK